MSKSILVIDTQECCEKCQLCSFGNYGTKRCTASNRSIFLKDNKHKPDWCPLKKTPQKLAEEKQLERIDRKGNMEAYGKAVDRYAVGYNACIDEILKERDENETD